MDVNGGRKASSIWLREKYLRILREESRVEGPPVVIISCQSPH